MARSFGPPAATAECAAPLLRPGGALVVSEPPGGAGDRWDADGLAALGLARETTEVVGGATFTRLRQVEACPEPIPVARGCRRAARSSEPLKVRWRLSTDSSTS